MALVLTFIFICLLAIVAVISICYDSRAYRAKRALHKQKQAEARQYHPWVREKEEADRRYELEREKFDQQQQKLDLERDRFRLESYLALTRVEVSQYGTYLVNQEQVPLLQLAPIHKPEKMLAAPTQTEVLQVSQPSQDFLLSHLEQNKWLVSPGVQASTGEVVIVDLLKVPHLKIIGSSGFGKSCLAAAILDQATRTNTPRKLQLALLDLEHKTSRLFEDRPHVAELQDGKRRVTMVATNADEVVSHLGILKKELDRRAALSEQELYRNNPVLLMYVEEMLSLQYEVVDQKLLAKMFTALTILAIRGRKYGMYLLSCMQSDYSTDELKVSQKQFRFRAAAAIDVPAARAAGFMNTDLIKDNFANGKPGQFVVEFPSSSNIVLAPAYDVRALLSQKDGMDKGFSGDFGGETPAPLSLVSKTETGVKPANSQPTGALQTAESDTANAWQAKVDEVRELLGQNWGKIAIIERVWRPVKVGSNKAYKTACAEYDQIVTLLEQQEAESEEAAPNRVKHP